MNKYITENEDLKSRPPSYVFFGKSVEWKIQPIDATLCPYRNFNWCERVNKTCCFNNCPLKLEDSFVIYKENSNE